MGINKVDLNLNVAEMWDREAEWERINPTKGKHTFIVWFCAVVYVKIKPILKLVIPLFIVNIISFTAFMYNRLQ